MDVIADWFAAARIRGTVFSRSVLSSPWGLEFPGAERVAFHVVARGNAWLEARPEPRIELAQGDVVLLTSGRTHRLSSGHDVRCTSIMDVVAQTPLGLDRTIRWGGEGTKTVLLCGAYEIDPYTSGPLMDLLPPIVHLPAAGVGEPVQTTLRLLLDEFRPPTAGRDSTIGRLVDLLLLYVLRAWSQSQADDFVGWLGALRDPQLAHALEQIHAEPARRWTVEFLATEVGMSRAAFARRFHQRVGHPPLEYLTRWRMTLAARMLTETELPIASVAERVGYTSEQAFNRAFARNRGVPPGRWRAQTLEG